MFTSIQLLYSLFMVSIEDLSLSNVLCVYLEYESHICIHTIYENQDYYQVDQSRKSI